MSRLKFLNIFGIFNKSCGKCEDNRKKDQEVIDNLNKIIANLRSDLSFAEDRVIHYKRIAFDFKKFHQ